MRGLLGVTAAAFSIGLAWACSGGGKPDTDSTPSVVSAERPECPVDSFSVTVWDTVRGQVTSRQVNAIPISGPITHVPEYHDCQRFINNRKYGPLVAIFAHHGLDSLFDQVTDSLTGMPLQAAAEIYSYDGAYSRLGIRQGFNCLYLTRKNGQWRASMIWADRDPDICLSPPTSGGHLLTVRDQQFPGLQTTDYPAVARWDWDERTGRQYISIFCGIGWCEVGETGFTSSHNLPPTTHLPPHAGTPGHPVPTPSENSRVLTIKGWYDEQYLAIPSASGLQPSVIQGTAIPDPVLERLSSTSYFDKQWTSSAFILLGAPPQDYSSKLGLQQGLNQIFLCTGDFAECPHPADETEPTCEAAADHKWWAMVTPGAGGKPRYFCVTRRTHPGVYIPGAVRWRWDPDDEKTWIRCPEGCCTVS